MNTTFARVGASVLLSAFNDRFLTVKNNFRFVKISDRKGKFLRFFSI